jgi:hypothetical protein
MKAQISLKLRPNNQITLTHGSWRKKERLPYANYEQSTPKRDYEEIAAKAAKKKEAGDRYKFWSDWRKTHLTAPLDIIQKSQRSKKNPACKLNKPKNFTYQSGQKVRESGSAIGLLMGQDTRFAHEVTLTLPANTHQAFTALAAHTGYAINRLFQPIRRKYGEMCHWFFVWEYQRRGALHLHICIYHPDECEGLWICAQLIEQWHKILIDISNLSDACLFTRKNKRECISRHKHQHHTAPIQKDVGAYFAKYAGKEESKNNWYCQKYPVSRFWGSSKAVKALVKAHSLEYSFDYCSEEIESEKKFQSIIENIIEKLSIVSSSAYDFLIQLKGEHRLNRYKNGRKILSHNDGKQIAEGTRYTFYFNKMEFMQAMELIKRECEFF